MFLDLRGGWSVARRRALASHRSDLKHDAVLAGLHKRSCSSDSPHEPALPERGPAKRGAASTRYRPNANVSPTKLLCICIGVWQKRGVDFRTCGGQKIAKGPLWRPSRLHVTNSTSPLPSSILWTQIVLLPRNTLMPVPVVNTAQMRQWEEATWAAGRSQESVINCVGSHLGRRASSMTAPDEMILILAGKGHNGDDAISAAAQLTDRRVELIRITDPVSDLSLVREVLSRQPGLIVDGLFGIGLDRPLDAGWRSLIDAVNQSKYPLLAVDVPSGLKADSGHPLGSAIRADVTLTLGAPKIGLLGTNAAQYVGRLELVPDIGLVPCPLTGELVWAVASDYRGYPPRRPAGANKGTFGHLVVFAGSPGYLGASVLAARAAQRAQPGLISLYTVPPVYDATASQLQAVMVHGWTPTSRWPNNVTAMVVGPGLAAPDLPDEVKAEAVNWWREAEVPVIADASALDWLAEGRTRTEAIRVITPHPGEAARLLHTSVDTVQSDRPGALRELSRSYGGCWVVLKGRHTLIGTEEGSIRVNSSGNPYLAQGGSGDILAGYIGGLLAQPELQRDVGQALCYAVWQHGAAADHLTDIRRNWIVEELLEWLGVSQR